MAYLILKWVHILSSTVLFGAGVGSAFHMFMANLRGDVAHIAAVSRVVVVADWVLTTPTVIIQPLTGVYLAHLMGLPLASKWLLWSSVLYVFAIGCWLPVVWLQIRLRDLAVAAHAAGRELPRAYHVKYHWWIVLGCAALTAFLAIFYLMVFKPY